MNISRENLGELDLRIRIDITENDYAEKVAKQLKEYQHKATVPGFRKGMAPMALIQRIYKSAIVADAVQDLLGESLYKYLDDEKLDIIGSPLSNEEMTGTPDFAKDKDYTFYFDAALFPEVNIEWEKIDTKLCSIKTTAKDIDTQIEDITERYGKFESPETVVEGSHIYGKAIELTKEGKLDDIKDPEITALFIGKKAQDAVVFNPSKAFTPSQIEKIFRLENAEAKKFKSDVRFELSGCSHITPAELNEELFEKVFPGQGIKELDKFRKAISAQIDKANNEQCQILFVNQVRKQLLDNFSSTMPEAFLKRWILSRNNDKNVTAETIEKDWAETYVPSLKWEFIDNALNKIQSIEPTQNEIVDYVKDVLRRSGSKQEDEDDAKYEERLEQSARTIAQDRNNVRQIVDKLTIDKTFALFKEKLNPEVEKVTAKEFGERATQQ